MASKRAALASLLIGIAASVATYLVAQQIDYLREQTEIQNYPELLNDIADGLAGHTCGRGGK